MKLKDFSKEQLNDLLSLEKDITISDIKNELQERENESINKLSSIQNKYFKRHTDTDLIFIKTHKWYHINTTDCCLPYTEIKFAYPTYNGNGQGEFFSISNCKHNWYSNQIEYVKKIYIEITEDEYNEGLEKFNKFYSTMQNLKDW